MENITKTKISKSLKKYHAKKQMKRELTYLLTITLILTYFFGMNKALESPVRAEEFINTKVSELPIEKLIQEPQELSEATEIVLDSVEDIKSYIIDKSLENNINPEIPLAIAECESNFRANAKNPSSSAKGTFQFIDRTWKYYCKGDVLNAKDNIDCFFELYQQHKNWWECHNILYN